LYIYNVSFLIKLKVTDDRVAITRDHTINDML